MTDHSGLKRVGRPVPNVWCVSIQETDRNLPAMQLKKYSKLIASSHVKQETSFTFVSVPDVGFRVWVKPVSHCKLEGASTEEQ